MKRLFINAVFHQMNKGNNLSKGLLSIDGKIAEIYNETIPKHEDCDIIDLNGYHVYPGFIDTHTHSFEGGLYSQSLDLSKADTLKHVLELIDDYYQKSKKQNIEQLDAFRFDENKIDDRRFPTMQELDSVCPDVPLVLRRIDGHSSITNNCAWKLYFESNNKLFTKEQQKFDSEGLFSKPEDNILRGSLNDNLVHWFHSNCSEQIILNAYQQASKIAAANGITTVHTMVGDSQQSIMHYRFLQDNLSNFDVEYILYPQSFNIKAALDEGAKRIGGCILADGSLGSYTASLRLPYSNKPGEYGLLYHDDEFWHDFISTAVKHDLQVAVHCIGDRAIKQINDVYLEISKHSPADLRHQLIHCELTPDDLISEIIVSGAVPVMQPSFDLYWGADNGFYQRVLGNERKNLMNRYKTFTDNNVKLTGGSDWYITELDALQGIKAAVNHNNPHERLNLFDAVKMYTINAAMLSHDENRLGSLEKGFDADLVCLDSEIQTNKDTIESKVMATYKQAKRVYSR